MISNTTKEPTILLTLKETADISGVTEVNLRNWIHHGAFKPTVPGKAGRGQTHRLSVQLVLGIAEACHRYGRSKCGCPMNLVKEILDQYLTWPWSAVEGMLGLHHDDYTEEALAKTGWRVKPMEKTEEWMKVDYPMHPNDERALIEYAKRIWRLRELILERLQEQARGVNQPGIKLGVPVQLGRRGVK